MDQYLIATFQEKIEEWIRFSVFNLDDESVRLDVTIEKVPGSSTRYRCIAIDITSEEMRARLEKCPILYNSVSSLDFSVRVRSCLARMGIRSIGQLVQYSSDDLMEIRGFGQKCLDEVRQKLAKIGLSLAGEG